MTALLKAAVSRGFVPNGVEDDEAAAEHFMKKVEAATKAESENATLKARLGELERKQEEAEEQRRTATEEEVDAAIKAGGCDPEARDIVVAAILADPEKGRKLIRATRKEDRRQGDNSRRTPKPETPVTPALGYGDVTEEEDRIRAESNTDRRRVMRAEWYTREQTRHIRAANVIDANLIVPIAQDAVITKLGIALAPLNAFCMQFSSVPMSPKIPQVVTLVSADYQAVVRNATTFDFTNTTREAITVAPDQLTMAWDLTNANIQDGLSMTAAAEANAIALATAIMRDVIAVIDATNFPGTKVTDKVSEWATSGVKNAFVVVANGRVRNLVVSPEIFAQIMHVDSKSFVLTPAQQGAGAYGFNGIWFHNLWARASGPVAGLAGFVCDPQAIAGVLGVPALAPGAAAAGLTTATATAPGAGVTIQFNSWYSTSSRMPRMSYDVVCGFAVGDETAGHVIIPAAEA